jgi:hypothetical protein
MISVLLAFGGVTLSAQQPAPHFHPGQWEIDSVTTVMGGRAVSSQTQLCARHQADFWKVAQDGLTCKEPKTHPVSGGIRVRVHCVYSKESLHSEIRSDVIENITYDGNGFTLTGTTTTDTVYQGVQPKQTSAHLQVSAHRLGECP